MNLKIIPSFLLLITFLAPSVARAQNNPLFTIQAGKPLFEIQPTMWGIFFEDINYAADGGLYAELVKNRSFEFPNRLAGWKTFGKVKLMDDGPFVRNPNYVRLLAPGHDHKHTGIENEGFTGIGVKESETYRFSVWARLPQGGSEEKIRVELVDPQSMAEQQAVASGTIAIQATATETVAVPGLGWKKYEVVLKPGKTLRKAVLRIFLVSAGTVDLEHISLFPADTWKGRENGLRRDLAQALADLHPGIFRFPGGCIVEGTDLATRYDWKKTVGPVENRPINENRWNYTFLHRFFPDYYQSYGLGFFEFFQLSEDIGAEPLPVISCGLACQFQNKDSSAHVPLCDLGPYIQDALDLIEFANGEVTSTWGKVRAEMGHPAPFGLKFLAVGNEQWGEEYPVRLEPFIKAIREAYPDVKIIGSSGPGSEGKQFEYLWPEMKRLKVDLVDEHYYRPELWFLSQGARYDQYDRNGPKVFAGEYACHGSGRKWNHFHAALMEAALMTGIERNADLVHMATYAPLFAHTEAWQWRPDLIWFDNLKVAKTASYYVQQLFSNYKGTHVLSLTMDGKPVTGGEGQNGLFASAVTDFQKQEIIVKVVNTSDQIHHVTLNIEGLSKKQKLSEGRCYILQSADLYAENSVEAPDMIVPKEKKIQPEGNSIKTTIGAGSLYVMVFKIL